MTRPGRKPIPESDRAAVARDHQVAVRFTADELDRIESWRRKVSNEIDADLGVDIRVDIGRATAIRALVNRALRAEGFKP